MYIYGYVYVKGMLVTRKYASKLILGTHQYIVWGLISNITHPDLEDRLKNELKKKNFSSKQQI